MLGGAMWFDAVRAWTTVRKKWAAGLAAVFGIVASCAMLPAQAAGDGLFAPTFPGTDWIVMDVATGRVLSEHGARNERYPASLTKLMTLELTFEALRAGRLTLDTSIPVSADAASVQPMKLDLVPGQEITVRQAILGITTLSANDAATALGQYLGEGSISQFADAMTARAQTLGMLHTRFRNPSGLPDPGQVVDAYDMAILARHILLTYPEYRYMFSVPSFDFEGRTFRNLDGMLRRYPGTIGMKTGYTDSARFNLVTAAVRDGRLLIGVELHARSWSTSYGTMAKLLDAGFASGAEPADLLAANHDAAPPADAPAMHSDAGRRVRITLQPRRAQGRLLDARLGGTAMDMPKDWTAQIGAYDTYAAARHQTLLLRRERVAGAARVVSVVRHHRRIWQVQVAELTESRARADCARLALRDRTCLVIAPRNEVLVERQAFPSQVAARQLR